MKKILLILLLLLIGLAGCGEPSNENQSSSLTIYTLNDLHGMVYNDAGGLSRIGNYLINAKSAHPENTLIISSGDMWQGTAISNMTQGAVIIEAMNTIGFDAMTIGNHEFDWGIDVIEGYQNGKGLDATFPMLAANIYEIATNEPVTWAQPYTIVEKGDVLVGIIGIIGANLVYSISPSIVAPFEFKEEMPLVMEYTKELRTVHHVDVVIVSVHGNTTNQHQQYANLSGDYQVDAIVDAHTHSTYAGQTLGNDYIYMPYVQAGSSGSHIGRIVLELDKDNRVYDGSASLINVRPTISSLNSELNTIFTRYNDIVKDISDEVLGTSGTVIDRNMGTAWAVDVLWQASGKEIGVINTGGIRASGFPINLNEEITVGHVWEIMPFDNIVKTVDMKVSDILETNSLSSSMKFSSNVIISQGSLFVNGVKLDDDDYVSVATIDFIFDNTRYRFLDGINQVNTGILYRDYLIDSIREHCKDDAKWYAEVLLP